MPVSIAIDDGPQASLWLSPAIIPGRLSGNSFVPASGSRLTPGSVYDFKVTVRNTGNEETTPPVGSGPVGPFAAARPMVVGGTSPTGGSSASVSNSAGFPELQLFDAGGNVVWSYVLGQSQNPSLPRDHVYGYSPSGKAFICVTDDPGGYNVQAIAAETIGSGTGRKRPGDLLFATQISATGGTGQWASAGLGFVPSRDLLYLAWSSAGNTAIQVIDLGPTDQPRSSQAIYVHPQQAGQVRFSPSGDVMAVIGQPGNLNNQILLYKTPRLDPLPWTRKGMPTAQLVVQLPISLQSIKPAGFEAIRIQSGTDTALIDSPTPGLPAVAVYLWVDTSSSVFDTVTAKQYPQGTSGSQQAPSGFIDRIAANGTASAVIDANWRASLPPPGLHFCAIAEAFTTAGTLPADPRQRIGTTLSLLERQIAQRNLVVM